MKRIATFFIATTLIAGGVSGAGNTKKALRLKAKADKAYENFVYTKAVDYYMKSLSEEEKLNAEVALKIADSFRLMNKPASAENWYAKVEDTNLMTDQDLMNYAQILLKNGNDKKAKEISSRIKSIDISKYERLESIDNVASYYADSLAYFVENMNINTEQSEFSPAYVDNGFAFVSNRERKGVSQASYGWDNTYFLDLYYSEVSDGQILEPKPMSKRINTIFHEGPAVFFDNGNKLIFTRNNFNLGEERTSVEGINKLKLYYSEKSAAGRWTKAVSLPFNSDDYSVGHPTYHEATSTLYFASDMSGGKGKSDLYKVTFINGKWGNPENLGDKINSIEDDLFPFISEEGILYFASQGHPGIGGLDVYQVDLGESDASVKNMGFPINTAADDFGMILEQNSGYLSSNREGGRGNDDIYKVDIYRYDIHARLVDAENGEELAGNLVATDIREASTVANSDSGKVSFNATRGRNIRFGGEKEGYAPTELLFNTVKIPLETEEAFTVDVPMKKNNLKADVFMVMNPGSTDLFSNDASLRSFEGDMSTLEEDLKAKYYVINQIYKVNAIFYDFDRDEIRDDASKELDHIISILNEYPFQIILGSHTDSRGTNAYNEDLAKRRAQSAYQYLLAKGISKDRIRFSSFGEHKLLNDCVDGVNCDQDQHQLNRRTEIRLSVEE